MGSVHSAGPDELLVISGGCLNRESKKIIIGSWGWAWWFRSDVQKMPLKVRNVKARCENVPTSDGTLVTISAVAECEFIQEQILIEIAISQFLGKSKEYIESAVVEKLETHLKAVTGTHTVDAINEDRHEFSEKVIYDAGPHIGRLGIGIDTLTITDLIQH